MVQDLFPDELIEVIHHKAICGDKCYNVSTGEARRLKDLPGKEKFRHSWLMDDISFCTSTGLWWLTYIEGKGMFCLLCRKHNTENAQNKKKIFNIAPSIRFRPATLREHVYVDRGCTQKSQQHGSAISKEHLQRTSCFEMEIQKEKLHGDEGIIKAFQAFYFVAKQEIANSKITPLLQLLESVGATGVDTFRHRSKGSVIEIFKTIGTALRNQVINDLQQAKCYGLLCDDVCDVATFEQMVTFVQYIKDGKIVVKFLTIDNLLEKSSSPNAQAMINLVKDRFINLGIDIKKVSSVATDGAAVMMGKKGGFAVKLREICPTLINIHCICHRLALACTDTVKGVNWIKKVELNLQQLWRFFENSAKRTAAYLKIQVTTKNIRLDEAKTRIVAKKLN